MGDPTLQHIQLLATKRERLTAAQLDAENQYIASVGRAWRAGGLTPAALLSRYNQFRTVALPGYTTRWRDADLPSLLQIKSLVRDEVDEWHGYEPWRGEPRPRDGVCVVYVLYDDSLAPVYVGSTEHFTSRLASHRQSKVFGAWTARRCADREEAYEVETAWQRQYLPRENRKVGR